MFELKCTGGSRQIVPEIDQVQMARGKYIYLAEIELMTRVPIFYSSFIVYHQQCFTSFQEIVIIFVFIVKTRYMHGRGNT